MNLLIVLHIDGHNGYQMGTIVFDRFRYTGSETRNCTGRHASTASLCCCTPSYSEVLIDQLRSGFRRLQRLYIKYFTSSHPDPD